MTRPVEHVVETVGGALRLHGVESTFEHVDRLVHVRSDPRESPSVEVPGRQQVGLSVVLFAHALHRDDAFVGGMPDLDVGRLFGHLIVIFILSDGFRVGGGCLFFQLVFRSALGNAKKHPITSQRPEGPPMLDDAHARGKLLDIRVSERVFRRLAVEPFPRKQGVSRGLETLGVLAAQHGKIVRVVPPAQTRVRLHSRAKNPKRARAGIVELHSMGGSRRLNDKSQKRTVSLVLPSELE